MAGTEFQIAATQSTDGDSIAAPVEGDSEDVGESADAAEDDGDSTDDSDTAGDSTEAGADESETTGDSTDTAVHNVTPTYYGAAAPKQKTATVAIKPQAAGQTLTLASSQTGDSDSEDRKTQESTAPGGSSTSAPVPGGGLWSADGPRNARRSPRFQYLTFQYSTAGAK